MINLQVIDHSTLMAFWLIFTRFLAISFQLPIFDNVTVPTMVKVLTTLILSYTFFPFVSGEVLKDIAYVGVDSFWMLTIFNALVGLILGYFVKAIMNIFIASGALITQQVGFAAVSYFDPSSGQQVGPFEKLIQWTVLIMIVSSGALLPMFKGIFNSFFSIHFYDMGKLATSPEFFLQFFKSVFLSALMLSSPMIFINMLINTVMGIIARTVPQMNIIMVSFAVNIGLGLLVFYSTSNEFFQVAMKMYTQKLGDWFQFII